MTRVAVLGCGPAGLAAAHAATTAGSTVVIYSKRRKSELYGAQYLHAPIPGVTNNSPEHVTVDLLGTHGGYRRKVYGQMADEVPSVSTEDLPPNHMAWDIRATYDALWEMYRSEVQDIHVNFDILRRTVTQNHDIVLSTLPAPYLCQQPRDHVFLSQDILALGDAPQRGVEVKRLVPSVRWLPEFRVLCNGDPSPAWYRAARVFGHTTVEWPLASRSADLSRSVVTPAQVRKPISTTCTCWPRIHRLGRYGKWQKGVLVHHAYEDALAICAESVHDG